MQITVLIDTENLKLVPTKAVRIFQPVGRYQFDTHVVVQPGKEKLTIIMVMIYSQQCKLYKYKYYLPIDFSDPDLDTPHTPHIPNLMSIFCCLILPKGCPSPRPSQKCHNM